MLTSRRTVRILLWSAIGVVLLLAGALLLVQTPWARDYVRTFAEQKAGAALGADVSIGGLSGNLVSGVGLEHVSIGRVEQPIVTAPKIDVDYSLLGLLTGDIGISSVRLEKPMVHVRRTKNGTLNLAALGQNADRPRTPDAIDPGGANGRHAATESAGEPAARGSASGRGWSVQHLAIEDGIVTLGPNVVTADAVDVPDQIVNLDATFSIRSRAGGGVLAAIDALSFKTVEPHMQVDSVSGELAWAPTLLRFDDLSIETSVGSIAVDGTIADRQSDAKYDVTVKANDLALSELSRFFPALERYHVTPDLEANVQGRLDELEVDAAVKTTAGTANATATLDLAAPERSAKATLHVRDLNLQPLSVDKPTDITMNANVDVRIPASGLSGLSGTYSVTAPEFRYGEYHASEVTASGQIDGPAVSVDASGDFFDGHGEASGTITLPSDGEDIRYDLRGRVRDVDPASVPAAASKVSALRGLPEGVDADFTLSGEGSDIDASARLSNLSFAGARFGRGTTVEVSKSGGRLRYAAEGSVHNLNLQRIGRAVGIEALTSPPYDSQINARFDVTGSGTALERLSLQGVVTLHDTEMFDAHIPRLTVRPDLTHGSGSVAVAGTVADLDLAKVVPNTALTSDLQGNISARLALDDLAHPSLSPGALSADVRLSLGKSRLSGVTLDSAAVDASVSDGVAHVRQLRLSGPELMVKASGPVALVPTAESDLDYAIHARALQQFDAVGLPLRGAVRLEGNVSGNPQSLKIAGTLAGTNVGYADVAVEALETTYEAELPARAPREIRGSARAELTQLTAAGTTVRSVTATATYADQVLGFRTSVEDAERDLQAKGRLAFDARQLTLDELQLSIRDTTWTLAGTQPALVAYRGDALRIDDLALASERGGRISADGELGSSDGPLSVTIEGLPLQQVRDLLPHDIPVSGVVEAKATVDGTLAAPAVDATVAVTHGSYRGFAFDRLGGTFHVTPDLIRLDARIVQDAAASLTAVGTVPLSDEAATGLDVHVESTPIDLALVETFTDEIQQVKGTAQMDVTVRGSRSSPTLHGSLHVRNGEFTVVVAQSHYTGFDTDITFDGNTAAISELHLVDDEENRLRISGRLPLAGGTAAGVNLRVHSDNFEFADNRLAELNADTDVTVNGDLLRPRIEGTVSIRESLIQVDRILELSRGPYRSPDSGSTAKREPALFEPLVDVSVRIPDTLLIRGSDLRAPNGIAVGLGDVNVTIGGNLRLRKQPGETLQLTGELQTVRGQYEFQGRQFAIERDGRIVFMGGVELNPRLDIEAVREISGVTASVHIGGVMDAPELSLSSQPPMDDAEILSLIVFNQPLSLVGTGAQVSLAARATALAAGFATSQLTKSLSDALEVDLLELEATTTDGTIAPALTVGEQFGQLFVKLRQRFGPEQVSEAIVEYRLAEWLRLQSNYVHSDVIDRNLVQRVKASGLDLLFLFSY